MRSENTDYPKISIITPSYNQSSFLEETIQSVLDQNYPNLEYIVIDGGSQDKSVSIIRKYEPYLKYWISEPDQGQSDAIRKGFQKCNGVLWNWLNSDDILEANALQNIAEAYLNQPKSTIYAGSLVVFGSDIQPFLYPCCFQSFQDLVCVWEHWGVPQPSLFISREACLRVGGINPELVYGMDYELYLRLTQQSDFDMVTVNHCLARIRRHPDSKTVSQSYLFQKEILEIFDNFTKNNTASLPKGWKRSRDLFAYITDLNLNEHKIGRSNSFFKEFIKISFKHKNIWRYRYFWGLLRREIGILGKH